VCSLQLRRRPTSKIHISMKFFYELIVVYCVRCMLNSSFWKNLQYKMWSFIDFSMKFWMCKDQLPSPYHKVTFRNLHFEFDSRCLYRFCWVESVVKSSLQEKSIRKIWTLNEFLVIFFIGRGIVAMTTMVALFWKIMCWMSSIEPKWDLGRGLHLGQLLVQKFLCTLELQKNFGKFLNVKTCVASHFLSPTFHFNLFWFLT